MNNKNIIFFVGGTVLGALAGVFGTRAHFEKKYAAYAEETIESMRAVMDRYSVSIGEELNGQEPVIAEETREALLRNHEGTNYAAIYGQLHPDSSKKKSQVEISGNVEEELDPELEEALDAAAEEMVAHHEANKGRKPRLISARAVHELSESTDICELQFYTEDEVLADGDTEEKIHDVARLVGDCLQKYDFVNSDERMIYIMNDELDTCYEVVKIDASYEETHM